MKKKWLVLDIDGTLTNSKKEITPDVLQALLLLQERGHGIMIATGRPTPGVRWIVDALQLPRFGGCVISFNGARVLNMTTREIVCQSVLPEYVIEELYEYAMDHRIGMITYEGDTVIHGTPEDNFMVYEAALNRMPLQYVEDFPEHVDFAVNKCLLTAPVEIAPAIEKELADRYKGILSIYRSEPYFIEAMPLGVDKAAAIENALKVLGGRKEDVVACGDGYNDISMIRYAGVGVAMKNAQDAVKEAADYVTEHTNDEDGLLEVIDRFF